MPRAGGQYVYGESLGPLWGFLSAGSVSRHSDRNDRRRGAREKYSRYLFSLHWVLVALAAGFLAGAGVDIGPMVSGQHEVRPQHAESGRDRRGCDLSVINIFG